MSALSFEVFGLEETTSTQDEASARAAAGAPAGTVVWAKRQEQGRGSRGRDWLTHAGSLAFSMLLRPALTPTKLPRLTQCVAAGLVDAFVEHDVWVKWPNDLMVPHATPGPFGPFRKWGGILVEATFSHGRPDAVIAGVGLNLVPPAGGFGDGLDGRAGSLCPAGTAIDRREVLDRVLNALGPRLVEAEDDAAFGALTERLWERSILVGRRVRVDDVVGRPVGINQGGALLVEDEAGQTHAIVAGEAHLVWAA